jgi:tRNA pseudouridine13 synthase
MLSFLSRSAGIGGIIKSAPQDFLVEEIAPDGAIYELGRQYSRPGEAGPYVHFILQKKNWTTASAISEISRNIGVQQRNFNTAGMKDKVSISTQLCSVSGTTKGRLESLSIRDIWINGAWEAAGRVRMGQLLGNRFTIRVREVSAEDADARSDAILAELSGRFPNYFGGQRFGSGRKNTHLVGEKLLRGELEDALIMFLCDSANERNEQVSKARKELADTRDFERALQSFPRHLRLERSIIAYLAKNPDGYANAFRRLPRNILLLFIHAFQSHLFNRMLSDRIGEGGAELEQGEYFCGETLGFPDTKKTEAEGWICGKLIGYGTALNGREEELLESCGLAKDAFRMKALPEIASKGSFRTLFAPLRDFGFKEDTFRFSLPSGSYATVAMREFMDEKHK